MSNADEMEFRNSFVQIDFQQFSSAVRRSSINERISGL